jgi:hypothetical protein
MTSGATVTDSTPLADTPGTVQLPSHEAARSKAEPGAVPGHAVVLVVIIVGVEQEPSDGSHSQLQTGAGGTALPMYDIADACAGQAIGTSPPPSHTRYGSVQ